MADTRSVIIKVLCFVLFALAAASLPDAALAQEIPLPRVEIRNPEFFFHSEGELAGVIRGASASTTADGLVEIREASLVWYHPRPRAEDGAVAESGPREVMLRARAGLVRWKQGTEHVDFERDFWVSFAPKEPTPDSASAASPPENKPTEGGSVRGPDAPAIAPSQITLEGRSARVEWEIATDRSGTIDLKEGRDVKIDGFDLRMAATILELSATVIPREPIKAGAEAVSEAASEDVADRLRTLTVTTPNGMTVALPERFQIEQQGDGVREFKATAATANRRYRVESQGRATLEMNREAYVDAAEIKLQAGGGVRVFPPGSELAVMSGNQILVSGILDEVPVALEAAVPDGAAPREVKQRFKPVEARVTGRALARIMDATARAGEIRIQFINEFSQHVSMTDSPSLIVDRDDEPGQGMTAASMELAASSSLALTLAPDLWVLEGVLGVRARIGFRSGSQLSMAGDSLRMEIDPPGGDGGKDDMLRKFSRLSPKEVRMVRSAGTGVLPRVAVNEAGIAGVGSGKRRIALFASVVEMRRAFGGLDVDAQGDEIRMVINVPIAASSILAARLVQGQSEPASAASFGDSDYEITTTDVMMARIERLGVDELTSESPGVIEIRTHRDTSVNEYPQDSDVRGYVAAGPIYARIELVPAPISADEASGGFSPLGQLALGHAEFQYTGSSGRMLAAIGPHIVEAAELHVLLTPETVAARVEGPGVFALRGKESVATISALLGTAAISGDESIYADQLRLVTDGAFVMETGMPGTSAAGTLRLRTVKGIEIVATQTGFLAINTGHLAVRDWESERAEVGEARMKWVSGPVTAEWGKPGVHRAGGTCRAEGPVSISFGPSIASVECASIELVSLGPVATARLYGKSTLKLSGMAASLIGAAVSAVGEEARQSSENAAPGALAKPSLVPAFPKPAEDDGRPSLEKRYPGGVVVTCDGVLSTSRSTRNRDTQNGAVPTESLDIVGDEGVTVVATRESAELVDTLSGDRLDAALWIKAEDFESELDRISRFELAGDVHATTGGMELAGDKLVYDAAARRFMMEGRRIGIGLSERAEVSGLTEIKVSEVAPSTGEEQDPDAPVGLKLVGSGKRITLRLRTNEVAAPPPAIEKAKD